MKIDLIWYKSINIPKYLSHLRFVHGHAMTFMTIIRDI